MSDLPEPSQWFTNHFGEHSQQVMLALANAGRAAHERSLDAKVGSRLATNDAYGSFWVSLLEEVVTLLDFLPGREVVRPPRSRYDLVVYEGTLIFPAKCGPGSSGADRIKLRKSGFRSRVFSLDAESAHTTQEQLDFEFELEAELDSHVRDGTFGSATQVALTAYDVSAHGGLQHVYVGDAVLDPSGLVNWQYREELPLLLLDGEGAALAGLGATSSARFDNAPLPDSDVRLRRPGDPQEVEEGTGDAGSGTDGDLDD